MSGEEREQTGALSLEARHLLSWMVQCRGFAVACDGEDRPLAHELEQHGFARWVGTTWGSSFWSVTDLGRAALGKDA